MTTTTNTREYDALSVKIRPDVEQIIFQSDSEFEKWYSERKTATERILADCKLFASIPDITTAHGSYTVGDDNNSIVRQQLNQLQVGLGYLEYIKEFRQKYHSK